MQRNTDKGQARSSSTWLWWIIGAAAILLLLFIIVPALNDQQDGIVQDVTPQVPATGEATVTIGEILADPGAYVGQMVTVTGEVERPLGTDALLLDEFGIVQDSILVVTPQGSTFTEGQGVVVEGTVRQATVADIEREFGLDLGLTPELEIELSQRPIIVAESVTVQNQGTQQ